MRILSACLSAVAAATACAQSVNDVGLTMDGGILTVIYGQMCGATSCTPFPAGSVHFHDTRTVTHYGAVNSPYIVAIGFPGPCLPFPGIGNNLLLLPPPLTLFVGVAVQPVLTGACRQAGARNTLTTPPSGPIGLVFRLQSLGVGNAGLPAFGPALEATLQ